MMPSSLHHILTSPVSSEEIFLALSAPKHLIQENQKSAENFYTVLFLLLFHQDIDFLNGGD